MQLDILFFYLTSEMRRSKEHPDDYEGFIRIADVENKKHIEKIEVSNVLETFNYLREKFSKFLLSSNHERIPNSKQCFGIMWDDDTSDLVSETSCLTCREIADGIKDYIVFMKQSSRFVKAG